MVASRTGLPYLDTGAMYRCVALQTLRNGIAVSNEDAIADIAESAHIVIEGSIALLGEEDVSSEIRSPEIAGIVSIIAAQSPVRTAMRQQQQRWISSHGGGVVEGRDIGTVVFPDAEVKIFLTASPEERAIRRVGQNGGNISTVAASIAERDRIDSERSDSPLRPADDGFIVDSTGLTIEQVVDIIVSKYHQQVGIHGG